MTEIRTRVLVGPDRRISGTALAAVPTSGHEVTITVAPHRSAHALVSRSTSMRYRLTTQDHGLKG